MNRQIMGARTVSHASNKPTTKRLPSYAEKKTVTTTIVRKTATVIQPKYGKNTLAGSLPKKLEEKSAVDVHPSQSIEHHGPSTRGDCPNCRCKSQSEQQSSDGKVKTMEERNDSVVIPEVKTETTCIDDVLDKDTKELDQISEACLKNALHADDFSILKLKDDESKEWRIVVTIKGPNGATIVVKTLVRIPYNVDTLIEKLQPKSTVVIEN